MRIDFFNVDQFCENIEPVTTNKIFAKRGFHPNGLFSERIFGPVRTCTCACNIYWGRSKIGEVCSKCGVEIGFSSLRRKKFGKIELPLKVINPIMYYIVVKAGKTTMKNIIQNMIFDDSIDGYYFDEETKKYIAIKNPEIETEEVELPEGTVVYSGAEGIYQLVKFESERHKDKNSTWEFVYNNLSDFFMENVIVCPPEFRPVSKTKDTQMRDKMNEFYMTILNFAMALENDVSTYAETRVQRQTFKHLQRYVFNFYEYIFSKFSKKSGLIRGSILGKRIDFSARAVISPDPQLTLDQCSIPYTMGLELFKLDVVNRLLEKRNIDGELMVRYDPTIEYVNDCIKLKNPILLDILNKIVEDKLIILNRQPTLHRMGLLSFKITINMDDVIKIHPCACEPYNADFDGDQMAAYISLYDKTELENKEKIFILNNLISPSTGKIILGINQDILLGLYLMTKEEATKKTQYKGKKKILGVDGIQKNTETTEGRVAFNEVFPSTFPFINKTIDKKELNVILNEIVKVYDPNTIKEMIDKIKELGLRETTLRGTTFSLRQLKGGDSYDIVSEIVDDEDMSISEKFHALNDHPHKKEIQENFPYADFIESGSRGSWDQANQLIFCRGYMSNSQGEIVPTPIKNNLVSGLTQDEFFISCYGSRKALLDVSLNTAVSGYLTRKLVYCNVNLELDEELDDCGTDRYLNLKIPKNLTENEIDEIVSTISNEKERNLKRDLLIKEQQEINPIKMAKSLIGRWHLDDNDELQLISNANYLDVCGKTIKLRSPIFCRSHQICKTCYGDTNKFCHSKYVGVISAQALGEVATQLTLRTFHTGGKAIMIKGQENESQQDIINDLSIVNKLLHGTLKLDYYELLIKLFSIYSNHRVLLLVHFECVISQMMRSGKLRWRTQPDRDEIDYNIVSIENVPSRESFLLALAFSKPYDYLISGVLGSNQMCDGILEKMLINNIN